MKYDNKSITIAGAELLSADIANKQPTVIEQMVVSDRQPEDLSNIAHLNLDDFNNALYYPVPIIHHQTNTFQPSGLITNNNVVVTDSNKSLLSNIETVNNQQVGVLDKDYDIQMVGLVGHTEDQNDNTLVAVAIANQGEAFTIPASTDIPYQLFFDIAVGYSNASNVIVNVNNAGYINQADLLNALQAYVTIGTDQVITGNKNFVSKLQHNGVDVATTKDTDNAYQNAVNTANAYADNYFNKIDPTSYSHRDTANTIDVNALTDSGTYTFVGNQNQPNAAPHSTNSTVILQVINDNHGNIFQVYYIPDNSRTYTRFCRRNQWTSWEQFATDDDVNALQQYVDFQFNRYSGFIVPTSVKNGNNTSYNAVSAYFNAHENRIYLHGFYTINNVNDVLQIDVSNIASYEQSYVDIAFTWFNYMPCWSSFPTHVYKNIISLTPKTTGTFSCEGVYIQLSQVDAEPIEHITIRVDNPNNNEFKYNDVWGDYTPSNNTVTLHGSITSSSNVNLNDPIFTFNISNLNMNEITGSYLNNQSFSVTTDNDLDDIQGTSTNALQSGYTWNAEGCTIKLGYDKTLAPKYGSVPSSFPQGTVVQDGTRILNITNPGTYIFLSGMTIPDSPYSNNDTFYVNIHNIWFSNGQYSITAYDATDANGNQYYVNSDYQGYFNNPAQGYGWAAGTNNREGGSNNNSNNNNSDDNNNTPTYIPKFNGTPFNVVWQKIKQSYHDNGLG